MKTEYTKAAYVADELKRAQVALIEVEKELLRYRKEAKTDWLEALRDPRLLAQRSSWLMGGSYGYGQCLMARRAVEGRGNKVARFAVLLASFEWRCPATMAREAFNSLNSREQAAATRAIEDELNQTEQWSVSESEGA